MESEASYDRLEYTVMVALANATSSAVADAPVMDSTSSALAHTMIITSARYPDECLERETKQALVRVDQAVFSNTAKALESPTLNPRRNAAFMTASSVRNPMPVLARCKANPGFGVAMNGESLA